jgi:sugar lactone lactonase YvrE
VAQGALLHPSAIAVDSAGNVYVADARLEQVLEFAAAGGAMTVVAGTGAEGFAGDGGAATSALLSGPSGVAIGADGSLYIADTGNARVRVVRGGVISTFAGGSVVGSGGDGGVATAAQLRLPTALAVATDGSLLIADTGNHRVRRVSPVGIITAFAGSGVEGFAGDGGAAVNAELAAPQGLAVLGDGRVVIADTRNERLRVVALNGTITTLAGSGVRGYRGDGGVATSAQLCLPRGVAVNAGGEVVFADLCNHRVRKIAADGTITTVAGSGVEGNATAAGSATAAALGSPAAVAFAANGAVLIADDETGVVAEVAADGSLAALSGGAASHGATVAAAVKNALYGQVEVLATVASGSPLPQGSMTLSEGGVVLGATVLQNAAGDIVLPRLAAGTHALLATYGGDLLHSTATTSVSITVQPAVVMATANAASIHYGDALPALSGNISGVLVQDVGNVSSVFATAAPNLATVGVYPITATLAGSASANYSVFMSAASGSLVVQPATPAVTVQASGNTYAGLSLPLSAMVLPPARGVASGTVVFSDGGTQIVSAALNGGTAAAVFVAPPAGTHSIVAAYSGDANFAAAQSAVTQIAVAAMPDFGLTCASCSQTVNAGSVASFDLVVAPTGGAFSGSIVFAVGGLPHGATATFSPSALVPGASTVHVTMSVQTLSAQLQRGAPAVFAAFLLCGFVLRGRRRCAAFCTLVCIALAGCGARTASQSKTATAYPLTVTATSTNLAGSVVTHTRSVTLNTI